MSTVSSGEKIPGFTGPARITPGSLIGLLALIAIGLLLRTAYLGQTTYNPDEPVGQAVSHGLRFPDHWDTNWARHEVPPHFRYDQYNFSSYHYLLHLWQKLLGGVGVKTVDSLGASRALNILLGGLLLVTLAVTARTSAGTAAGLAAVAAGAVFPLLVQDAHYVRCEAMLSAGVGVLLWWSLRTGSEPTKASLLGIGGFAGWLVACKATMVLVFPLLLLRLLPPSPGGVVSWSASTRHGSFLTLGIAGGFALGVPFGVLHPSAYLSGLQHLAQEYAAPFPPFTQPDMAPCRWVTLAYLQSTAGWGFWILTMVGIAGLFRSLCWARLLLLLAPGCLAFLLFGRQPFFSERSYSPFLPIACLLFGAGIQTVADFLGSQGRLRRPALAGGVTLILILSLLIPSVWSWTIVFQGFSGREDRAQDAAILQMRGHRPGQELSFLGSRYNQTHTQAIASAVAANQGVLILVMDAHDPASRDAVASIRAQFGGEVLGVRDSIFAGVPTCTLHTFISQRLWLLYLPPK